MKINLFLSILIIFVFPSTVLTQSSARDTLKIYQEIAGDYEFYPNQQYYSIQLYIENMSLLFKGQDESNIQKIIPVDFDSLKFKISDSDKIIFLSFQRNVNNEISSCRLITNESEFRGNKLNTKADSIQIADKIYSIEALKADLTQIKNILISNHPAVYQFTSKELFEKIFNKQIGKINRPMNLREFYLIAAPIVESVHCGHISIEMPYKFWNNESQTSFPIKLTFIGDKAYVFSFYNNENLVPIGSEIASINKIPMADIIKSLKGLISSDGKNQTWKLEILKFTFPYLYALQYGFCEHFEVEYIFPNNKEINTQIMNPIKISSIWERSRTDTVKTSTGDPNLNFEVDNNKNLAVITIKSFIYYQETKKFYSFIDSAFEQINKSNIQNLILDLRNNTGGDPFCTSHLLSYLESKPIPYFAKAYPYGYEHFAEPIPLAIKNTFNSNLFVLINGGSFSSTGHLCSILKFRKRCTFIGEETGGTFECNDAHTLFNPKETRLNLNVARMTFTTATDGLSREHGIMPDYYVEPKTEDIIDGKDTVKEFTYGLIKKSK
jgi:Periplasmic protease